jgi:hypothetical protein
MEVYLLSLSVPDEQRRGALIAGITDGRVDLP